MAALIDSLLVAGGLDPSKNYSFLTVPVALYLCLTPHYLAVATAGIAVYDNSAPRSFQENVRRDTSIDKIVRLPAHPLLLHTHPHVKYTYTHTYMYAY